MNFHFFLVLFQHNQQGTFRLKVSIRFQLEILFHPMPEQNLSTISTLNVFEFKGTIVSSFFTFVSVAIYTIGTFSNKFLQTRVIIISH